MSEREQMQSPLIEVSLSRSQRSSGAAAGVSLMERAFCGHFNLRLDAGDREAMEVVETALKQALPVVPNKVSSTLQYTVLWLGPDEWLVICDSQSVDETGALLETTLAPFFSAVNDLSGGQTILRLTGEHALDTLAKGCTLDLHPRVFAPGDCAQTQIAKTAVIIRPLPSNTPTYDVVVRRSMADYLWRWLSKAAAEYGIEALSSK